MNQEREALILARDAVEQAESNSPEADRLLKIYASRLDDLLQRQPGLARSALEKAVGLGPSLSPVRSRRRLKQTPECRNRSRPRREACCWAFRSRIPLTAGRTKARRV